MADVITGLYDFTLPDVGGSDDTWGDKLNANWQKMETLLAASFPSGTPATLGERIVLSGGSPRIEFTETDAVSPAGRYRFIGQVAGSFALVKAGADGTYTSPGVIWNTDGTTFTITAPLKVGSIYVGADPTGTAAPVSLSAATGSTLYLRSGVDANGLTQFLNAAGAVAARIEPPGTALPTGTSIVTQEKGDARYAQLGVSNIFTSIPIIRNAAPELRFEETDQTDPAGRYRLLTTGDSFGLYRSTAASWGSTAAVWIYSGLTDALIFYHGANVVSARIEAPGTAISDAKAIVTREKGDARYLELDGTGEMTGSLTAPSATISDFQIGVSTSVIKRTTGNMVFDVVTGASELFRINNVNAALVEPGGTSITSALAIVTKEKGDARYLQLAGGTVTGNSAFSGTVAFSAGLSANDIRVGLAAGFIEMLAGSLGIAVPTAQVIAFKIGGTGAATAAAVNAAGTASPATYTIITREKGDLRYSLASSQRFKEAFAPRSQASLLAVFDALVPSGWTWGGELPESDERHGMPGVGFGVEDVEPVFPEAVRYQWDGDLLDENNAPLPTLPAKRAHGLDPLALIAVLHAKITELQTRLAAVEV